jgi:hypothetical protein
MRPKRSLPLLERSLSYYGMSLNAVIFKKNYPSEIDDQLKVLLTRDLAHDLLTVS